MSVVGFDIGQQTSYIAVARHGGIETVANEYSDRCTPTCISMGEKNRFIGASAKNQMVTNVRNSVWGWKRLIGRKFNDPIVQKEMTKLTYKVVDVERSPAVSVSYLGEEQTFRPEQLFAMILSKLKETAESSLKMKVVDCVISVPCYYVDVERRAVLDAAATVGLNVLRLMNETTATALSYGIYKQDLPTPEEKPRNVVFVDLGAADLQLSVCAFNKGKVKVLATEADRELGGFELDSLIADYFIDDFSKRYKINVRSNPRAYIRLLQESERLKKLMSANSQEIPLNIECFMEDKDVSGKMKRETLETLAEGIFQRIEALFRQVLDLSKLSLNDIYAVEIVGGSVRIPAFKELVKKVFGKEASTTLNGDEAVARGCALQCAILSPTFKVRDFQITDTQAYPIHLTWQGTVEDEQGWDDAEVFPRFYGVPSTRLLTFYRKGPFELFGRYQSPDIPEADSKIGKFTVDKVAPQNGEVAKVKVKVRVNINGLFSVSSATTTEKIEGSAEEQMEVDGATNGPAATGDAPEAAAAAPTGGKGAKNGGGKQNGKKKAEEAAAQKSEANEEEEESAETSAADKKSSPKKTKVKVIDLPIIPDVPRLSKQMINSLMEKEGQMVMQDKLEKERADAKNAVEEYVYETRNRLGDDDLAPFMKDEDKDSLLLKLEDTENWLYEEGEDQQKQVYVDRLSSLKKLGQPVVERCREHADRPAAFELLGQSIQLITKVVDAYDQKDEKYAHLEAADVEKVRSAVKEKREWFERNVNLCSRLAGHENPPITVSQIKSQRESLVSTCNPTINKPKPKPKEEPPKEAPKETPAAAPTDNKNESNNTESQPEAEQKPEEAENQPQPEGEGEKSAAAADAGTGGEGAAAAVDMDLD